MPDDSLPEIAAEESEDTFASITDLDSICDTGVLAITFLLSAQVSLTTYIVGSTSVPTWRRAVFVTLGLITMVFIFLSLNAMIRTLLPVGFYSDNVGDVLLDSPWFPVSSNTTQFRFLSDSDDETADQPTYQQAAEEFVSSYSSESVISNVEDYQVAKLTHYKRVGKRKANLTGKGLAWLRLAVTAFIIQFGFLFVGELF